MEEKQSKINFLENLLNSSQKNVQSLIEINGKDSLKEKGKVIFVSDCAPTNEECHIYLKLDEKNNLYFNIKKTMNHKLSLENWNSENCSTVEETIKSAQRYLPSGYEEFVQNLYL